MFALKCSSVWINLLFAFAKRIEYINSEDEDYSLSLSAVIQRRASVRGRKKGYYSPRRASSPMGHVSGVCGIPAGNSIAVSKADRRRSSVYTTSSGE